MKLKTVLFWFLAVALVAVPLGACARPERSVKIAFSLDLTGPIAISGKGFLGGAQQAVRYMNDKGGINGVKVELLWADDQFSPAKSLDNYKRLREQGILVFMEQGSTSALAVKPLAERDKVPMLSFGVDPPLIDPPSIGFAIGDTAHADLFVGFLTWLKQTWKEARPPRVGIVGYDNALGRSPLFARSYWENMGITLVGSEFGPPTAADWTPQLLRLKAANPDFVFVGVTHPTSEMILRDAERVGLLGKVGIVMNGVSIQIDDSLAGVGPLAEGVYWANIAAIPSETNLPGVKLVQELDSKYGQKTSYSGMRSFAQTLVAIEGIRRAMDKVGYEKLNGEAVYDALLTLKDFDTGGILNPITLGPDDRRGNERMRMIQIKGGKPVSISDWISVPFVKAQ